jgi:putative hydrolase of HD superfamily
MNTDRLMKQIEFILEIDKLKQIFRQNVITEVHRNENDAEHSWHLAVMAIVLQEYLQDKNIDVLRVIKMLLIHDIVEIDAGDTFCYDEKAHEDKAERECKAAERIFNILPKDQAQEIWDLWQEFEKKETPEAQFAACIDRLQPLLLNYYTEGHTWHKPGVTPEKVLKRNSIIEKHMPEIWKYVKEIVKDSVNKGYFEKKQRSLDEECYKNLY